MVYSLIQLVEYKSAGRSPSPRSRPGVARLEKEGRALVLETEVCKSRWIGGIKIIQVAWNMVSLLLLLLSSEALEKAPYSRFCYIYLLRRHAEKRER